MNKDSLLYPQINSSRNIENNLNYQKIYPIIVIDTIFFQFYKTGIARVWRSLLEEWAASGYAKHIVVLDRVGTAPKISGIRYRNVQQYDYSKTDADRIMLQQVCNEENADLFVSTYYTTPISTPSVFMAYDMIPEIMRWNLAEPMWREKHYAIRHAYRYIAISENTARDLAKFFPHIHASSITVAHCGVKSIFSPAIPEEISSFKVKYSISKPYFLLVGASTGYKNTILFIQAFAKLTNKQDFEIVYTGASFLSESDRKAFLSGITIHKLQLEDEELKLAYSGAVALVYPSKYEGFGLPILEALSCGCPVITCANASIPEVAGEAAIYVNDSDVDELTKALSEVQKLDVRQSLISAGLSQSKKFSWSKMADLVSSALQSAAANIENAKKASAELSVHVEKFERQLLEETIDSSQFLNLVSGCMNLYEIDPEDESVLADLRLIRKRIANFWLSAAVEELESLYLGNIGKAHQILQNSAFKKTQLTEVEQTFVDELVEKLAKGLDNSRAINYRLAAMLYCLENEGDRTHFPNWLQ
ncbi:glycosyltransferase family 4 protein [Planktothrix sp. FACHB-1355]|uniref:glycosyltransferase family 4 protein n=1 Tax=Planktothrix sp. FACHB-1355 TaxID=2692854 RepID=UPI00168A47DE|nr:glycosyltransferase family 1 protein [Planktothrix sp. FACHB-1355]MBD3559262.1 glycosyltransferase family 4 protein [Planktothrix sp. FACHB-1355]